MKMTRTVAWRFFAAAMAAMMIVSLGAGVITPGRVEAAAYTAWSDKGIVYTAPAPGAYYPSVLYDLNGFGSTGPKYNMWYSDGSVIFLVNSTDGILWSAPTTMSGLGSHANHVQVLYDANGFGLGVSGPKYKIWYENTTIIYSIASIDTAQSDDGVNWTNEKAVSQDESAQLVTGISTDWNYGSYGPIYLFYQAGAANSGTDPWSYSYIMYYDAATGSTEETALAYSADGLLWTKYSTNPVLPFSGGSAWDSKYAVYGTVYHDALGFHYWYSGGISHAYEGIGYASSTDGKTWTKDPNYIFNISQGVSYRNGRVYTPAVINDGTGTLKMYYTAVGIDGLKKIGWAAQLSSAKAITAFDFNGLTPAVTGTVDNVSHTVALTVPYGTPVDNLTPTITVSAGATVSPLSGAATNFTTPQTYTVTAADATTQDYAVTVTVAANSAKAITAFDFNALSPAVIGAVDNVAHTVALIVPYGTPVDNLTPTITITGTSVSPLSGVAQNFTDNVTYTVTAADASTQAYTVTVTFAANTAKAISTFDFNALSPAVIGAVDNVAHTVALTVPFGTVVTALVPTITISGASVSPASGVAQDFTSPVTYTVHAADSSTQPYTVTVTVAANSAKAISTFDFDGLTPHVIGTVTESTHTVALTVPFGTVVTALVPTITISGASVNPASGVAQDFTSPVTYTVHASDSSTQPYVVTVTFAANTARAITAFDFNGLTPHVIGTVTESTHTVALTVPFGTAVTALVPTITITGASVNPASGVAQNFTSPVTYTVHAADASTQAYTVTVHVAANRHAAGDYNGSGKADDSVWRPNGGNWFVYPNFSPTQFGLNGDIPVPGDYNGDGTTDRAVWRPSTGMWYVYPDSTHPTQFGLHGDVPVPADYNGDNTTEFAVWRPHGGNWFVYPSLTPTQFGLSTDIPVPADYNGDGKAEFAVYRPHGGLWFVYPSLTPIQFGLSGDIPVPADYNGDGKAEFAVWRPSTGMWYVYPDLTHPVQFGLNGDVPGTILPSVHYLKFPH